MKKGNFEWAVKQMMNDKEVRRKKWSNNTWMFFKDSYGVFKAYGDGIRTCRANAMSAEFKYKDIIAIDWEVFEKQDIQVKIIVNGVTKQKVSFDQYNDEEKFYKFFKKKSNLCNIFKNENVEEFIIEIERR